MSTLRSNVNSQLEMHQLLCNLIWVESDSHVSKPTQGNSFIFPHASILYTISFWLTHTLFWYILPLQCPPNKFCCLFNKKQTMICISLYYLIGQAKVNLNIIRDNAFTADWLLLSRGQNGWQAFHEI